MHGDLGVGKTMMCRSLFYKLGVNTSQIICSPSYNYLCYYSTNIGKIAHLDLYRIDDHFDFASLGIDSEPVVGYFIEWPDNYSNLYSYLPPSHIIHLEFVEKDCLVYKKDTEDKFVEEYDNLLVDQSILLSDNKDNLDYSKLRKFTLQ